MTKHIYAYSGAHDDVIRQFEMDNKPPLPFCAEKDTLRKLVQYALKMAFYDFNFRTLKKEKSKNGNLLDEKYREWEARKKEALRQMSKEEKADQEAPSVTMYLMERLGKPFEERFITYFTQAPLSENEFETWHNETCQLFLNNLDGNDGNNAHFKIYRNLNYGKAQKIVNMMFKHLYCFHSSEDWKTRWEPYFRHCHVTLDNFTLEWFKREIPPHQRINSWSNLVYREKPVDINDYLFYQTSIRKFFSCQEENSVYHHVTPFQAEFYIWPQIQLQLAAEAFIFELNPKKYKGKETAPTDARAGIADLSVDDLLKQATHEIREYELREYEKMCK